MQINANFWRARLGEFVQTRSINLDSAEPWQGDDAAHVLQIQVADGSIKGGNAEDDLSDAFALGHGWGGGPGIFNYYYYYYYCSTIIALLAMGRGSTLYQ